MKKQINRQKTISLIPKGWGREKKKKIQPGPIPIGTEDDALKHCIMSRLGACRVLPVLVFWGRGPLCWPNISPGSGNMHLPSTGKQCLV